MKGMRHSNRISHMRSNDIVRGRDDREKTPEEDTSTTIGEKNLTVNMKLFLGNPTLSKEISV